MSHGPLTPGVFARQLDELARRIEAESIVFFTDDRVHCAAERLAEALESQIAAAQVVRGARRLDVS